MWGQPAVIQSVLWALFLGVSWPECEADYAPSVVLRLKNGVIQCVPLATEPGISLIILPVMRILQRNLKRTADTFLFISHTTNVLLFKFRCNIFIGVRIIKEMPGSVTSGTHCIFTSPYPFMACTGTAIFCFFTYFHMCVYVCVCMYIYVYFMLQKIFKNKNISKI